MAGLLEHIETPSLLRNLRREQLHLLSAELRPYLLTPVSSTGGHLSANLRTLE